MLSEQRACIRLRALIEALQLNSFKLRTHLGHQLLGILELLAHLVILRGNTLQPLIECILLRCPLRAFFLEPRRSLLQLIARFRRLRS